MTEGMTAKLAAMEVRNMLRRLEDDGGTLRWPDDTTITIPPGISFAVRATRRGVNITVEDRGWVDQVTGGDRHTIGEHRAEQEEITAEVDKVRHQFTPPLPGETKWGRIFIDASPVWVSQDDGQGWPYQPTWEPPGGWPDDL